jgi:beta-glucanase (GH16 family)
MKRIFKPIVLVFAVFLSGCKSDEPGLQPFGASGEWELTFRDEFEGEILDTSKWSVGYGWGRKTGWTQEAIDDRFVKVNGGKLFLSSAPRGENEYSAGAVNTKNKFFQEFGFFEARIKAAKGQGVLTGWWGKPNTEQWPPEIDIAEIFGAVNPKGDPTIGPWKNSMNIHFKKDKDSAKEEDQTFYTLPDNALFTDDYHILAVEWNPDELIWYIDGKEVKRTNKGAEYLRGDFYWILNLHICSTHLTWPGCPEPDNVWPSFMEVDYVRAWKKKSST